MTWRERLMQALKESTTGNYLPLAELSQMARREIVSDQYFSRLSQRRTDGAMDVKMKQANDV